MGKYREMSLKVIKVVFSPKKRRLKRSKDECPFYSKVCQNKCCVPNIRLPPVHRTCGVFEIEQSRKEQTRGRGCILGKGVSKRSKKVVLRGKKRFQSRSLVFPKNTYNN